MKNKYLLSGLLIFLYYIGVAQTISIPLGGNSWVTKKTGKETVQNSGWENWNSSESVFSTYVFAHKTGSVQVMANITLSEGNSSIQCSINGKSFITDIKEGTNNYSLGNFTVNATGYFKIDVKGVKKSGVTFGKLDALQLSGSAIDENTSFVKNNEGNFFYWGRRGPSVHLNYDLKEVPGEIEYFYNEIIVPKGNDVIGSYFMANGFAEGYFGMQVNSETERRILFSVWSPFQTDDPKAIPEDKRILMLKKGTDVYTGEFGNEGSGGQSYLKYYWNAGDTCRFLLRAKKLENNYTNYTAWFYLPKDKHWKLIASFSRPYTSTHLKRLHSFLENFNPSTGNVTRKAIYRNQWARTTDGKWYSIKNASFTYDATARKQYRLDYAGGTENGNFYLQNCGFFNNRTEYQSKLTIAPFSNPPVIQFEELDKREAN